MKKFYLSGILFCLSGIFSLSAQTGLWTDEGNYSTDWFDNDYDPDHYAEYHLSSARDLAGLAYLSRTASFENKKIILDGDIDLSGHYWRPIGGYDSDESGRFSGKFDGGGYIIKNMKVDIRKEGEVGRKISVRGGLFAKLFRATIQNLTLDDNSSVIVTIEGSGYDFFSVYGGGFAGQAISTLFVNCHNHASVEVRKEQWSLEENAEGVYAGGIAGQSTGQILSCTNTGVIMGFAERQNVNYTVQAGGMVGNADCSTGEETRIAGCENQGTVKAVNLSSVAYAGGIAGNGNEETVRCSNSGEITVEGIDKAYAGGIAGGGFGAITECTNNGKIVAGGDNEAYIGGIAGFGSDNIFGCINRGEIKSSSLQATSAGGIVGDRGYGAESLLSCCYNTADVACTVSTGESYSGGIVGFNCHPLRNCGNSGHIGIMAEGESPVYAGGIAGMTDYIIWNCYNRGNVEARIENTSTDAGKVWAGGIAGKCLISSGLNINCYTTAGVTVSSSSEAYAGLMSGESFPYRSCYYLSEAVVSGTENIFTEGIPLSADKMQAESFVTQLNAEAARLSGAMGWEFRPGENDGYPVLSKIPAAVDYTAPDHPGEIFGVEGYLVIRTSCPADYRIYDVRGVLVTTLHAEAGETRIALPSGIYLVKGRIIRI